MRPDAMGSSGDGFWQTGNPITTRCLFRQARALLGTEASPV